MAFVDNQPINQVVLYDASGNAITTLPVSAASLPLPAGASTEAKLELVRALLATIDADTSALVGVDYATQATLATRATETKLEAVRALLATIDADTSTLVGVDYATQTTLATLATESKLEAVRALLATIDADTGTLAGVDYATQTTLATLATESKLEAVRVLLTTRATESKLEAVRALLATIDADTSSLAAKDYATETSLSALLVNSADIETILTAIRDTAGIKKIVDALPAGTNNIGDVDVDSVVPGTGAANLGKAENAVHTTGDVGVMALGVQAVSNVTALPTADGDYTALQINKQGQIRVNPGKTHAVDVFNATTGWTVVNDDAANLATTTNHISAANALTWDKVNGTANTKFAMIQKTITSLDFTTLSTGVTFIQPTLLIPDLTNVVNVVVRLGTDSSNYNEWRIPAEAIDAGVFRVVKALAGDCQGSTGNGWNALAITYVAVGLEFSAETDTLAGIVWDVLTIAGGSVSQIGAVTQGKKSPLIDAWPIIPVDEFGTPISITDDAGVHRLEIQGKVQTIGAVPPPLTLPAVITADTPLTVGNDDTTFTIPDGETFHLQQITAGNEDPSKGAVIEVLFDDGSEHVIERIYTAGQSISIGFPDTDVARDGTPLLGDSGSTSDIIVRRVKFSGSDIAIDAVVLGYTV